MSEILSATDILKKLQAESQEGQKMLALHEEQFEELKQVIVECKMFSTYTEELQRGMLFLLAEYSTISTDKRVMEYGQVLVQDFKAFAPPEEKK